MAVGTNIEQSHAQYNPHHHQRVDGDVVYLAAFLGGGIGCGFSVCLGIRNLGRAIRVDIFHGDVGGVHRAFMPSTIESMRASVPRSNGLLSHLNRPRIDSTSSLLMTISPLARLTATAKSLGPRIITPSIMA